MVQIVTQRISIPSKYSAVWLVLILLICMPSLTSCVTTQEKVISVTIVPTASPIPTFGPPENWEYRWLREIPCRPPCWEGITPGRTNATEAIEILNRSPLVTKIQMETFSLVPNLGSVYWNWANGARGGEAVFEAQTTAQLIYEIKPRFPQSLFNLREVMQAYGEPSHIVAQAYSNPDIGSGITYELWIIYLDKGFVLTAGYLNKKPDLSQSTRFDYVLFFIPTRDGLAKSVYVASNHPEWVLSWQGFKGFDFYCRDESNGRLCAGK
jgi:hypothetical protein